MTSLNISLFDNFEIQKKNGKSINFRSDRILGLLSYLISESDRPHKREKLLTLIWPDASEKQARNNLRVALHRIRQALDDIHTAIQAIMT